MRNKAGAVGFVIRQSSARLARGCLPNSLARIDVTVETENGSFVGPAAKKSTDRGRDSALNI